MKLKLKNYTKEIIGTTNVETSMLYGKLIVYSYIKLLHNELKFEIAELIDRDFAPRVIS